MLVGYERGVWDSASANDLKYPIKKYTGDRTFPFVEKDQNLRALHLVP